MMTHVELQADVVKLLALTGWSHLHCRRSLGKGRKWVTATNIAGWPDLWCWSPRQPGRFLAIEVKVPPDDLRADQAAVLAGLGSAGAECYVVQPAGLEELARVLSPRGRSALASVRYLPDHDTKGPRP